MKVNIFLFLLLFSHFISAQEISIYPNGLVLPSVRDTALPTISTPGHVLYNIDHRRTEIFTSNFTWEGISSSKLIDKDGDTQILLEEGFTQGSEDRIQFKINNTNKFSFGVNEAKIPRLVFQGGSNNFIGASAGRDASTATHNIAIGSSALANNEAGNYNIAIGSDALKNMNTQEGQTQFGKHNTAIGSKALENVDGFSGDNVAIGYEAGASGGSQSIFLGYQAGKEATDLSNTLYINNAAGNNALIYGEFDQGKVVINSNGGTVEDALLINGNSALHGPMRIKVDGATKFRVHKNGGLSIGTHAAPFDNGLKVANLDEAGPPTPLYADDRGNVTRRSGDMYKILPAMVFRADDWNSSNTTSDYNSIELAPSYPPFMPPSLAISIWSMPVYYARLDLPHKSTLSRIDFTYLDNCGTCEFRLRVAKISINNPDPNNWILNGEDVIQIGSFETTYENIGERTTDYLDFNETIDNENFYYLIVVENGALPLNPIVTFYNAKLTYHY